MSYEINTNNNTPNNQDNQDLSKIVQDLQTEREKIILSENPSENEITSYINKSLRFIEELDQKQTVLQKELQNYDKTRDNVLKKLNILEQRQTTFREAIERIEKRDEEIYMMLSTLTEKTSKIEEKTSNIETNHKKIKSDIESLKESLQTSNNVISGKIDTILTTLTNYETKQHNQEMMLYGMLGLLIAIVLILFFKL
jgi:chromosome segregation ATPase